MHSFYVDYENGLSRTGTRIGRVVLKISRRAISTLRRLEYLEASIDDAVAMGYDPYSTTNPSSPASGPLLSHSASPLESGSDRKFGGLARDLVLKGRWFLEDMPPRDV